MVSIIVINKAKKVMVPIFPGYLLPYQMPETGALGSGFIISEKGLIVTNHHVVEGVDQINIQFSNDDKEYPAKVIGYDVSLTLLFCR